MLLIIFLKRNLASIARLLRSALRDHRMGLPTLRALTMCYKLEQIALSPPEESCTHLIEEVSGFCASLSEAGRHRFLLILTEMQREDLTPTMAGNLTTTAPGQGLLLRLCKDAFSIEGRHRTLLAFRRALRNSAEELMKPDVLHTERVTWDHPARLLHNVAKCDAVHPITSLSMLQRRFAADRRCYCLSHPAAPDPLAAAHVALTDRPVSTILDLIEPEAAHHEPHDASCATFYSITVCRPELRSMGLGRILITQALESLQHELPNIKQLVTLSPAPGFMRWLRAHPNRIDDILESTQKLIRETDVAGHPGIGTQREGEVRTIEQLRPILVQSAARYLTEVLPSGRVADPVAHFHLSNGARLENIVWSANPTKRGLDESAGLMIIYRYNPNSLEKNRGHYKLDRVVPRSRAVQHLMDP